MDPRHSIIKGPHPIKNFAVIQVVVTKSFLCKSCRLDESKNRNLKLQEEVRIIKRECESLKQRYEEEALGKEREK